MSEHYYDPVEIWSYEEREGAYKRIVKLELELTKCHELQDSYCDRIAELEAERRWIPVSERLPEDISNVLVLSRGEQLIGSYHSGYELWYVPFVDKPVVTHWMPLPEPPEVRNG